MWHRCDKELPPKPGRYLIYFYYQDDIFVSYWDGTKWEQQGWLSITHWTELPDKPEDAKDAGLGMGALIYVPMKG